MAEDKKKTREELLDELAKATKELSDAKAAKKRDARAHNDRISDIEDKIDDIMSQLENA